MKDSTPIRVGGFLECGGGEGTTHGVTVQISAARLVGFSGNSLIEKVQPIGSPVERLSPYGVEGMEFDCIGDDSVPALLLSFFSQRSHH